MALILYFKTAFTSVKAVWEHFAVQERSFTGPTIGGISFENKQIQKWNPVPDGFIDNVFGYRQFINNCSG